MVQHFANGFLNHGIVKQDLILFYADNSIDYVIGAICTAFLGVTYSPVTPANGVFELIQQIRDSSGSVLLFGKEKVPVIKQALDDAQYCKTIKGLKLLVQLETDLPDLSIVKHPSSPSVVKSFDQIMDSGNQKLLKQIPYFPTKSTDPFTVIYTSGTTGLPKGTVHNHFTVLASILNLQLKIDVSHLKIITSLWYPIGHISGTLSIFNNTLNGWTSIVHNSTNIEKLMKACYKYKVNYFPISSSIAIDLVNVDYTKLYELSSLKVMSFAGSKIPSNLLQTIRQRYQTLILEKYGATEFMGSVDDYHLGTELSKPGNVGFPLNQVEMKIVDVQSGKNLPANQNGEICFRGPPRFVCYLNNEKATKETIDENEWYHSGDLGYYDENGALYIVDRIKELIKFQHWSIAPAEIEDFLHRHPAIEASCVIGVKHISGTQLIRAYVQIKNGNQITEAEIVNYVQTNMGIQKRLYGGVHFVRQIQRTAIGKVDRKFYRNLIKDVVLENDISSFS